MTKIYSVLFATTWGDTECGIVRSFTTPQEATRYKELLDSEADPDMYFYVEVSSLYNKIEEING